MEKQPKKSPTPPTHPTSADQRKYKKKEKNIMFHYKEEKEAKKEAFRKYLESSGVLDALTRVLVALYEQNEKPSSALEFVQQKLGVPSVSDYEKLQAELSELQKKYSTLSAAYQETCTELEGLKSSQLLNVASLSIKDKETAGEEALKEKI